MPYVQSQLSHWLNRDLYAMFKQVLRDNGGKMPRLGAGLREQCKERVRCMPPLSAGRRPNTPQRCREVESMLK